MGRETGGVCPAAGQPRRGAPPPGGTLLTCPGRRSARAQTPPPPPPARRRFALHRRGPCSPGAGGNSQSPLRNRPGAGSRTSQVAGSLSLRHLGGFRTRLAPSASSPFPRGLCGAAAGGRHSRVTKMCPRRDRGPSRSPASSGAATLLLPAERMQEPRARALGQALTGGFEDGRSCPEIIKHLLFVNAQAEGD